MARTAGYRYARYSAAPIAARVATVDSYAGYRYSLLAPPLSGRDRTAPEALAYTLRSVTPSLRPLMERTGNRCPDCGGPLVNGEGCIACPVCGFRRQGW